MWILMRNAVLAATVCLLVGSAQAAEKKIGYVDLDAVTKKAVFVRDLMGDLEASLNTKRSELESKQEAYARLRDELDKRRAVLKESEIEAKLRQSRQLRDEIEQLDYEINRMFRQAEKKQMGPALDHILETIRKVGEEENYDLVLRGEIVLYGKPAVDISNLVADRLNRDYRSGAIKIEGLSQAARPPAAARQPGPQAGKTTNRRPALSDDDARLRASGGNKK